MSQSSNLRENGSNELEIIEFYIEEDLGNGKVYRGHYGMNVAKVLEIIRRPNVTGVPSKHHKAALGTFNLRGRVMPLVDLSLWLEKEMPHNESDKVIVSEFSGVVTAFLVSGVTRIHRLSWAQVEPPSKHVQAYSHQSVTGVIRFEDRILFILDMEKIISTMDPSLNMDTMLEKAIAESDNIAAQSSPIIIPDANNFHILISDDSTSIRTMIAKTLEHTGYNVIKTASGKEAWDILLKLKAKSVAENIPIHSLVDLVISDIEMPEMDGHALTKHIKEDPVLKALPVILFSSLITDTLRHKGEKVGADDQISKPDLPILTQKVRQIIQAKHGK